jgi:hypothetical protein
MTVVPAVMPVAVPLPAPDGIMVATAVLVLVHVPPGVASLSPIVDPRHMDVNPCIAAGTGLTVTTAVSKQPAPVI